MQNNRSIRVRLFLLILLFCLALLTGCTSADAATAGEAGQPQPETAAAYKSITIPGPVTANLELPEGWDFYGNAGWLSPDNGQTLAGLRLTFISPDKDAKRLLFNEDAVILEQSDITIGDLAVTRYKVESYMTIAATGERNLEGYELIYAFPAKDPELMAGVFVRAATLEALEQAEPVVEHMASSLTWE